MEVAFKRLLASVDVSVLLEVLSKCEALEADYADMLLDLLMGSHVPPQGEPGGVGFVAARLSAEIGSLHAARFYF